MMNKQQGVILLKLARSAIANHLGLSLGEPSIENSDWLKEQSATFVTLHKARELRGCIGSLKAHQPLLEDVCSNAVNAAFKDPRFAPLDIDEFERIHIEVSVLTTPEIIHFSSEAEALAQLRPHIDGVIFECGYNHATFLPQVWEQLPTAEVFMQHLKQKAGLSSTFWSATVHLSRYQVEKFSEQIQSARGEL